jgi:hypothetical protein
VMGRAQSLWFLCWMKFQKAIIANRQVYNEPLNLG